MLKQFNQPIKFIEDYEKQDYKKSWCKDVDGMRDTVFVTPQNRSIPFQIKAEPGTVIFVVFAVNINTGAQIVVGISPTDKEIYQFADYNLFVNFGNDVLATNIPTGLYYYKVSAPGQTWISENVFYVYGHDDDDVFMTDCNIIKIEYRDECRVGGVFYGAEKNGNLYKNRFYLMGNIGKPLYKHKDSGKLDGYQELRKDYSKLTKYYRIELLNTEIVTDAINLMALHREIIIETRYNKYENIKDYEVRTKWEENGCYATNIITYYDEYNFNSECCNDTEQPILGCIAHESTVVATMSEGSSEYNSFLYEDAANPTNYIYLKNGDRVMVVDSNGIYNVKIYRDNAYHDDFTNYPKGYVIRDMNATNGNLQTQLYYFGGTTTDGWKKKIVIGYVDEQIGFARGVTFRTGLVRIYDDNSQLIGNGTAAEFHSQDGISINLAPNTYYIYALSVGDDCTQSQSSNYYLN